MAKQPLSLALSKVFFVTRASGSICAGPFIDAKVVILKLCFKAHEHGIRRVPCHVQAFTDIAEGFLPKRPFYVLARLKSYSPKRFLLVGLQYSLS